MLRIDGTYLRYMAWVIFFAMLVPLRPRQHLIGAVLSAAIVASGVLVFAVLLWTKPTAPRRADSNRVLDVAVVTVSPVVESTPILGHGTVRAKKQVDIVPQVSGKLVWVHEHLAMV